MMNDALKHHGDSKDSKDRQHVNRAEKEVRAPINPLTGGAAYLRVFILY